VYTDQGKGGGISLVSDFVLNTSLLDEREQRDILSAVQGLSGIMAAETSQVLRKLSAMFNKNAVNWLETDFSDWNYSDRGTFDNFKAAILERRIAEFDYYGASGEKTRRRVEPVRLLFKSRAWYVMAFCLTRQDERLFKLLRVRNLALADAHFAERDLPPAAPDPELARPERPDIFLKLKIAPEMTYRIHDEFGGDAIEKQGDGSFIVSMTYSESEWVYGFILSFGEHIEVLEPEHLRKIIGEKAQRIAGKYR